MPKSGLIPAWANDARTGNRLANARADTLASKSAFRSALKRRGCLVILDEYMRVAQG
jgi:putative SOS response-associated peptidase YedK